MLDIESYILSLKATWVSRINDNAEKDSNWNFLPKLYLDKCGKRSIYLQYTYDKEGSFCQANSIPLFYQQILYAYSKAKITSRPVNEDDILNQLVIYGEIDLYSIRMKIKKTVTIFPQLYI